MMNPPEADLEQQDIARMMATDDFGGLGQKLQQLMRMPQSLCKMRGDCCRIATFKGAISYEKLRELAKSNDDDAENARDFLTLFLPYESQQAVRDIAPIFVERVLALASSEEERQNTSFFKCKFVGDDGRCQVHEDRPTGCRVYPFPHEKTIYHPGCGFEQKGMENWRKIQEIMQFFERRMQELEGEMTMLESEIESNSDDETP